jgi:transposase
MARPETSQHRNAFEEWYAAGRDFRKISEKSGTKLSTLYDWADRYGWQERASGYDAETEQARRKGREAEHLAEIAAYRERAYAVAVQTSQMAIALLYKAGMRLKALDIMEITPAMIPRYLRTAAAVLEYSLNAEAEAIGVRRLEHLLDSDTLETDD